MNVLADINPIAYFVIFLMVLCVGLCVWAMHREERWHHHRKFRNFENHEEARLAGKPVYEYTNPYGSVSLRRVTA